MKGDDVFGDAIQLPHSTGPLAVYPPTLAREPRVLFQFDSIRSGVSMMLTVDIETEDRLWEDGPKPGEAMKVSKAHPLLSTRSMISVVTPMNLTRYRH